MKEIDFIPEWYKANRIRKIRCVRRYTLFGVLFVLMMLWSFIAGHHVKTVSAQVDGLQAALETSKARIEASMDLENEIAVMKQKSTVLDTIVPRTKVTAVIAELSYLVQDSIVISKLSLANEAIERSQQDRRTGLKSVVQIGQSKEDMDGVLSQTPQRMSVTLTGIAAQPADAASLIARLEEAAYFEQVTLVFSRPQDMQGRDVTEFEIQCYVADYQIQK